MANITRVLLWHCFLRLCHRFSLMFFHCFGCELRPIVLEFREQLRHCWVYVYATLQTLICLGYVNKSVDENAVINRFMSYCVYAAQKRNTKWFLEPNTIIKKRKNIGDKAIRSKSRCIMHNISNRKTAGCSLVDSK